METKVPILYFFLAEGNFNLRRVSPEQWGRSKKFKRFVATVKLLADHTWDVLKKGEEEV